MTPELKEKIRTSMMEHLKAKGWPDNLDNNGIVRELSALWDKLAKEGLLTDLVTRGFTFQHFHAIALDKKFQVETMEEMMAFFRRGQR